MIDDSVDHIRRPIHYEASTIDPRDGEVLKFFMDECNSRLWKTKPNWFTETNVSNWFGITVNELGRVVEIELQKNNLLGNSTISTAVIKYY